MPLFLLKNVQGPRYKDFYNFFVIPLLGHFYPSKNEKKSPKLKFVGLYCQMSPKKHTAVFKILHKYYMICPNTLDMILFLMLLVLLWTITILLFLICLHHCSQMKYLNNTVFSPPLEHI